MAQREPTFRLWVGGTITALYAVSVIVDFFVAMYDPPAGIHSLMLIVAGGLFGGQVVAAVRKSAE